jgi:predicted MPP superfamily phosphohydrolase
MTSTSRRAFLLAPLLGIPTAAYARLVEPTWLEQTEHDCLIPGLTQPVRLAHLSDLHASADVPISLIERAVEMVIASNPDLICITGDFVTTATGFDPQWYITVLSRLSRKAPTFAVLGNHDGGMWSAPRGGLPTTGKVAGFLEQADVHVLVNRSMKITPNGTDLQMVGVGDLWAGELDADQAFQEVDNESPAILLAHNPDSKTQAADFDWRLMLSGHTHGGQVVAPVLGFSPAPVEDRRYVRGLKPWRDRWIHVSTGVGNIGGFRFNCRPEVTMLHLLPAAIKSL